MSTRAVIQIRKTSKYTQPDNPNNGLKIQQYYHHYDGYTSGLGIELVQHLLTLIQTKEPKELEHLSDIKFYFDNVFTQLYEKEKTEVIHGDIEYFYLMDFDGGLSLTRYKRNYDIDKEETMSDPTKWADVEVLFRAEDKENYFSLDLLNYSKKID